MGEEHTRDKSHSWQGNVFNRVQLRWSEILSLTSHLSPGNATYGEIFLINLGHILR